ncbi:MAG: Predicted transcriptional regulator for fatty acid degradation FadQ, TetR family [uncultured Paraburkholderia sp.]|nr:MAG: Predicted transcriptional regulator for fatty acid degradation FadQ, TetR family [uncultured Paraburkholderia sp.]CAH2916508.1 MAG: Predicted transcriptional regulator for fatty acid degradation FadQ, TetR family [uncultured Paraburkholderia sp.]
MFAAVLGDATDSDTSADTSAGSDGAAPNREHKAAAAAHEAPREAGGLGLSACAADAFLAPAASGTRASSAAGFDGKPRGGTLEARAVLPQALHGTT